MDNNYDLVTYNFYKDIINVVNSYGKSLPIEIASHILKQVSTEIQNQYLRQVNQKLTRLSETENNYGNKF